ncbi:MAG TPA: alpha/beta hydrolase-fold protein [Terriglobales bacterium]|nr:alpha/beta hydrolase-fold protein [Terriglobales bacterium]
MRNFWSSPFLLFIVALFGTGSIILASAQDNGVDDKIQIQSAILKQSRSVVVHKPASYQDGTDRNSVLYLLDGQDFLKFTTAITNNLAENDRAPELIIVAIDSGEFPQRTHDLTPPTQSEIDNRFNPGGGGADAFRGFISNELMPYIQQHYRTRPYKIFAGHSLGGLFGVDTLIKKPELFNAYLLLDPTLSWNNEGEITPAFLEKTQHLQADLFLAAANRYGSAAADIQHFVAMLQKRTPDAEFRWHYTWMKEESHGSIPLIGIYSGLLSIFDQWQMVNPLEVYEQGGMEAVHKFYRDGNKRYGVDRDLPPFTISLVVAGLINAGWLEDAATVLLHDPKNYPPPWNQLDALARNYAARGDREKAIHYYQLSLQENPSNEAAKQKLKEFGVSVEPRQLNQQK